MTAAYKDDNAVGSWQGRRWDSLKDPGFFAFYTCIWIQRKSVLSCNFVSHGSSFLLCFLWYCLCVSSIQRPEHNLLPQSMWSPVLLIVPCCFRRPYDRSSAAHPAEASLWAAEQEVGPGDLRGPFQPKLLHESMKETFTSQPSRWEVDMHLGCWKVRDGRCVVCWLMARFEGSWEQLVRHWLGEGQAAGMSGQALTSQVQWERQFRCVLCNFSWTLSGKYDGWFNESLWVCGLCLPVGEICFTPALSHIIRSKNVLFWNFLFIFCNKSSDSWNKAVHGFILFKSTDSNSQTRRNCGKRNRRFGLRRKMSNKWQ